VVLTDRNQSGIDYREGLGLYTIAPRATMFFEVGAPVMAKVNRVALCFLSLRSSGLHSYVLACV
jgi:hypothetical protein